MDKRSISNTAYHKAVVSGAYALANLFNQLTNLIVTLQHAESSPTSTVQALRVSGVLFTFSCLETTVNFFGELAARSSEGLEGSPAVAHPLTQTELDALREQQTYLDTRTGDLKVKGSVFIPTVDKLAIVPHLLGKVHGHHFRLDKSGQQWRDLVSFKDLRNALTHVKFDIPVMVSDFPVSMVNHDIKPPVEVTPLGLFKGVGAFRWYYGELLSLVALLYGEGVNKGLSSLLHSLDMVLWMAQMNLHRIAGLTWKEFARSCPLGMHVELTTPIPENIQPGGKLVVKLRLKDTPFQITLETES